MIDVFYATFSTSSILPELSDETAHLSLARIENDVVYLGFEPSMPTIASELQSRYRFSPDKFNLVASPSDRILSSMKDTIFDLITGEQTDSSIISVHLPNVTSFERSVLEELQKIPRGETRAYGQVARAIEAPRSYRAVAGACGRNPIAVLIPCHRVVAANGIGGFSSGLAMKRALLKRERSGEEGERDGDVDMSDSDL